MKENYQNEECKEHQRIAVAINMNPGALESNRYFCIECLSIYPLKAKQCQVFDKAVVHLLEKKKAFKWRKEIQLKNNLTTLNDLSKFIKNIKINYAQMFDDIEKAINDNIEQHQDVYKDLELNLKNVDLNQYLSNDNQFATQQLSYQGFKKKCSQFLESLLNPSVKEEFNGIYKSLDIQPILLLSEKKISTKSHLQINSQLSFKCIEHDLEVRWYDENQSTQKEERLKCDRCLRGKCGPFRDILSIYEDWEQLKENELKLIEDTKVKQSQKLKDIINVLKLDQNTDFPINQTIITLEKVQEESEEIFGAEMKKIQKDWNSLTKEQILKIAERLTEPILKEKKQHKRSQKLQQKVDQIEQKIKDFITPYIQSMQVQIQKIAESINYIEKEKSKEFEAQNILMNQIQFQTVREVNNQAWSNVSIINEYILKFLGIEKALKLQHKNEKLIQQQFDRILSFGNKNQISHEDMFKQFSESLFIFIKNQFSQDCPQLKNETEFVSGLYLKSQFISPPMKKDFSQLLNILNSQFSKNLMIIDQKFRNSKFYENFTMSIEKKKKQSQKQEILSIDKFYQYKVTVKWITRADLQKYMQNFMLAELEEYCNKDKIPDKQEFLEYLLSFSIFGLEIVQQNVSQLYDMLINWCTDDKKKKQQLLLSCYQQYFSGQNSDCAQFIKKNCPQLVKFLQQKEEFFEKDDQKLFSFIEFYYNGDNILFEFQKEIALQNIDELLVNNNKITYSLEISASNCEQENLSPIKCTFEYILNPLNNVKFYKEFQQNIVFIVQQLLGDQKDQGWNKFYNKIYTMIQQLLSDIKDNPRLLNKFDSKVQQNLILIIKNIIQRIQDNIFDFNMEISNFGVILNDEGESLIFQQAIFIIWRTLCYIQYQSIKKKNNTLEIDMQYQLFKAEIQENLKEQSKIKGEIFAQDIVTQATERLYQNYSLEAAQIIKQNNQSSYELIKKLDNDILFREDKNVTERQIVQYVNNQTDYIERYVEQKINILKKQITKKFTQQLQMDMQLHLEKVITNTKNLDNLVKYSSRAEDYFSQNNQDHAPELLYQIVLGCLQGQVQQQLLDMIQSQKKIIFETNGLYKFTEPLCDYPSQHAQIYILKDFIQGLQCQLDGFLVEQKKIELDFEQLNIRTYLKDLKLNLIGCLEKCPICNRKCDQQIDNDNHIHQCQNGHQLRGMGGIVIGYHPSLYSCEEIEDDFLIQELGQKDYKLWKQIKLLYPKWNFSSLQNEEIKQKFSTIWNFYIGAIICKYQSLEYGSNIFYVKKKTINKSCHYVFILDQCFQQNLTVILKLLSNNPTSKMTIIIRDSNGASFVLDNEMINDEKIEGKNKLISKDPFLLAYEKTVRSQSFDSFQEHIVFIQTESASIAENNYKIFDALSPQIRNNFKFIAITMNTNQQLSRIVDYLKKQYFGVILKSYYQPQFLCQTWIEALPYVL